MPPQVATPRSSALSYLYQSADLATIADLYLGLPLL
jgi:hypothetical protein